MWRNVCWHFYLGMLGVVITTLALYSVLNLNSAQSYGFLAIRARVFSSRARVFPRCARAPHSITRWGVGACRAPPEIFWKFCDELATHWPAKSRPLSNTVAHERFLLSLPPRQAWESGFLIAAISFSRCSSVISSPKTLSIPAIAPLK